MNLNDMRTIVRRDLHDEDRPLRWTMMNGTGTRASGEDYSEAVPYEQKAIGATTSGIETSTSALSDRSMWKPWNIGELFHADTSVILSGEDTITYSGEIPEA